MLSLFLSPNISNTSDSILLSDTSPLNRGLKITFCTVVGVVALLGNLLVIFAVCRVPRMKTTTFYLIVNMSVSDILFTVISMPPFILSIAGYGLLVGGTLGTFLCKFVNSSTFGLMASSVLTMAAIAFDRYFVITKPMRDTINMVILQRIVIAIWLISFLTSSPLIYSFRLGQDKIGNFCYEQWAPVFNEETGSRIYTLFGFIVIYMVPFVTIAVLYSLVARHLWFGKSSRNSQTQVNLLKSRRKVVIMLITVLIFFIICWLPLQIMALLTYFSEIEGNKEILFVGEFLVRTNAAINPMLYMIFSSTFRQAVKDAFLRSRRRPTSTSIITTSPGKGTSNSKIPVPVDSYFRKMSIYHYTDSFSSLKKETTL